MLARMLASAPMIPTPANMTSTGGDPAEHRHGVLVAVPDSGDRHHAPPQCAAAGPDVRVGRRLWNCSTNTLNDEYDERGQDGDEGCVLAAMGDDIPAPVLSRSDLGTIV